MKIIILGTAYPYRGGLSAFNERLAYEYQSQGHEVEIYTFTHQYPDFLFPGKTQYSTEPEPEGLKIVRKVHSYNPFNWIKVGREIKRKRPDVMITKFWLPFMAPCFGTIARIVRRNKHTRLISILDNVIPHEHRIGDKMFVRYFIRPTDGFVAMSKSVLADLRLFTADKPAVFSPHPLYDHYGKRLPREEALSLLKLSPDSCYVLFFGFIRSYKGLDLLLEAFADNRLKEDNVKLIVAGEFYGDSEPYLKQIKDSSSALHRFHPRQRSKPLLQRCRHCGTALQNRHAKRRNPDCLPLRETDARDQRGRPARNRARRPNRLCDGARPETDCRCTAPLLRGKQTGGIRTECGGRKEAIRVVGIHSFH